MTLSHRAEQAAPDEARGLLEELFLQPRYAGRVNPITFRLFLDIIDTPEAHLAAAMMLVPEGWNWTCESEGAACVFRYPQKSDASDYLEHQAEAATPALALIAAIARSVE